ncbi:MAG: LCP family protein, partial [Desulfobacterales bacterium]|nr:LCP family protein [Desulfobacterales bacterium]
MSNKEQNIKFTRKDFVNMVGLGLASAALSACESSSKQIGNLNKILKTTLTSEPSLTPNPTVTETPAPTETSTPEPTPDERTYFEKYIYPALNEVAIKRRNERADKDPDFWYRVDKELNRNRINFVLLGIGSERILTDSNQILSLDLDSGEIRIVSVYRSLKAPEVSRYKGTDKRFYVNQAFAIGGIPLVETVIENATGLSADFTIALQMEVLSRGVKNIFDDHLEVCIPWEIPDVNMGYFPAGLYELSGRGVLKVSRARYYNTDFSRQEIQQYVLKAMFTRAKSELAGGPLDAAKLITRGIKFLNDETKSGEVKTNFDNAVFVDIAKEMVGQIMASGLVKTESVGMPYLGARRALATELMGVSWDPELRRPIGGNPDADDLVK